MENLLTIMNFSHVYEREKFFLDKEYNWIDCTDINGTNGYCDEDAFNEIKEKLKDLKPKGIHFIDSGNYHYVSELWINKIKRDFTLIVFDHHSDMVKPSFGDILSCGSWIMDAIDKNKFLKKVFIIGLSKEQKQTIPNKYLSKVKCICDYDLKSIDKEKLCGFLDDEYPVYISIDKDVLSEKVVDTSWDQGIMSFDKLIRILHVILSNYQVIGLDICGENDVRKVIEIRNNDKVNSKLVNFLEEEVKHLYLDKLNKSNIYYSNKI